MNTAQLFKGNDSLIFQIPNSQEIPTTIAVRGIRRQVGTTSIVANLALAAAQNGEKVLLLDLCLRNCDLTRAFGHEPSPALIDLATELDARDTLSLDSVDRYVKSSRPNLDLLPGAQDWLNSPSLRGENGWNIIHALLVCAMDRWNNVIVDLGSHVPRDKSGDNTFLVSSAAHASLLQASSLIVGVCDSIEQLKLWQEQPYQDSSLQDKTTYIVNQHRADLPFGLDQYKLDASMRARSHFILPVKGGLLADDNRSFFMDRVLQSEALSAEERKTLREFQDLAARVNRQISYQEKSNRSTNAFPNTQP